MSLVLITSILVRLGGAVWAGILFVRLRDWRLALFAAALGLMAVQGLILQSRGMEPAALDLTEWPGLLVSVLAVMAIAGFGRIIRDRRRTEESLRRRARQQGAVASLGHYALVGNDLSLLFDEAAAVVASVLDVNYGKVLELQEGVLRLVSGVGWEAGAVGHASVENSKKSQAGFTLATDEPVVLTDAGTEDRFELPSLLREHGVVSGISVVIPSLDGPFGVLGAHSRRVQQFTEDDIHFIVSVANILAAAIHGQQSALALQASEERLRQSQKLEAIGRLAGGVAHDFNNLLTAIMGYNALLGELLEGEELVEKHTREIRKATERAAGLTQQLLAFARRQVIRPRVIDVNDVVQNLENMLERVIGEDVELRTSLQDDLPCVKTDRGQIEQVLLNLAINARDAMPTGGRLTITTGMVSDTEPARRDVRLKPGPHLNIAITDTGGGMDAETQARIFDPFFTTKAEGKGTGLGLSTVYGIVKQSGGYIWVDSALDEGATFEVWLPTVEERPEARMEGTVRSTRGTETILLVEDDVSVRSLAREVLESHGYNVLEADDGNDALSIGETHGSPIDLLLTDVVMPHMDGPALAGHVTERHPGARVLFVSGYPEEICGEHGLLLSDLPLLNKPFSPQTLAGKVREVLDGPRLSG